LLFAFEAAPGRRGGNNERLRLNPEENRIRFAHTLRSETKTTDPLRKGGVNEI